MSIIEQAAKRLEELRRAGVDVPWAAAGMTEAEFNALTAKAGATMPEPLVMPSPAALPADGAQVRASAAAPPQGGVGAVPPQGSEPATESDAGSREPGPQGESLPGEGAGRRSRQVQLDHARLVRMNFLVPEHTQHQLADEFRVIKRPLLKNVQGQSAAPIERANLIAVTSALPGEGKSFCAINLALSIAMEVDKTVLLIDADVVQPTVMGRLGLQAEKGLMDVLVDPELTLSDVLLRTSVPKLTVLPAGSRNANSTELLASEGMERLLDELATKYADRIVVFDAPPLLPATESRVLASRMGQVVMVVEFGRTTHSSVAEAFATVENCPVVMSVLNKCQGPGTSYRYGYYGR